jgi:hypothetical protein
MQSSRFVRAPLSRGNEVSQPPLVALPILAFAACPMSGHERRFRDVGESNPAVTDEVI